jgi:hypothetical protein
VATPNADGGAADDLGLAEPAALGGAGGAQALVGVGALSEVRDVVGEVAADLERQGADQRRERRPG